MIIMIAAAAENNALGKDNELIWHLPDDFKRFKAMTSGHSIIMGRKTFESFPKLLPNRLHIIVTRQKNYQPENCLVAHNLEKALSLISDKQDAFIIGGGEIYKQALPFTDKIELTLVHDSFDADTYFPEINEKEWNLIHEEYHPKDEKHKVDFTYKTFIKK